MAFDDRGEGAERSSASMSSTVAALLILDLVACAAWMAYRFRVHRNPSLLGLTFLFALIRYGVMAVPYSRDPQLPFPIPATYPLFLAATFTCYVFGATVASWVMQFDMHAAQRRFFEQPAEQRSSVALPVFGAIFLATAVVGVYFVTATEHTGLEMLINYGGEQRILRTFSEEFGAANPYAYAGTVINWVIGPMLIMVASNLWRSNRRLAWAAAAAAVFVLLVFTSTASLSKAPIIMVMLYILTNGFLSKWDGGKIKPRAIAIPVAVMLALGTLGYALTYGKSIGDALDDTISRIFVVPLVSVHGFLYVYPNVVPFANGMGIGLVARMFDVPNFVTPDAIVGTLASGPNTCFDSIWTTDLWANFGWAGVFVGGAFVGALLLFLDRWCLMRKRTAVTVALYAFMLVSSTQLTEASIFTMLLSGGLATAPILAWLLEIESRKLPTGATPVGAKRGPWQRRKIAPESTLS
ncbi:MAG: hypothetical protein ACRELB_05385 [Polyangiaceae bacterium]